MTNAEAGLINQLWIPSTILFAVPLLGKRAGPWLVPGLLVASAGTLLVVIAGSGWSWQELRRSASQNAAPYLLAVYHFGVDANLRYDVEVIFPSGIRVLRKGIVPGAAYEMREDG